MTTQRALLIGLLLVNGIVEFANSADLDLVYAAAPVDNPLKGLVPYTFASGRDRFPHSLEFQYFSVRDLLKDWSQFDWKPLEKTLHEVAGRGNQTIFRVYFEYPGHENEVPQFLIDEGVHVTEWSSDDGQCFTPDYDDPRMRRAMKQFIAELGKKYDGDPRVAFITAGLLGKWGEWHDYPRTELFASKSVQTEVMDSLANAFHKTKVLLRYPAGASDYAYAENSRRPFGYHDDSFAWATLKTGREEDDWFFVPKLEAAGPEAIKKWQSFPIGGEIRPELWKRSFTERPHEQQQDFAECVRQTHATWLMDSGLFDVQISMSADRKHRAEEMVRRMGYELFVSRAVLHNGELNLTVENRGVAPFYYDWPIEVRYSSPNIRTRPIFPAWRLTKVLPGAPVTWKVPLSVTSNQMVAIRIRVKNPLTDGKPLVFANREMNEGWLEFSLE